MNKQLASKTFCPLVCNPFDYSINKDGEIFSNNRKKILPGITIRPGRKSKEYHLTVNNRTKNLHLFELLGFQFEDLRDPEKCWPIPGFENRYILSIKENVCDLVGRKLLEKEKDSHGCDRVTLIGSNGKKYAIRVAKLIQKTFYSSVNFDEFVPVINHNEYIINKKGVMYSLKGRRFMSQLHHDGYLYYNVRFLPNSVHRILATQFIPNPDNLTDVDHIDGDTYNNSLDNLRWTSHQENSSNRINHFNSITLEDESGKKIRIDGWDNMREHLKVCRHTILNAIRRYGDKNIFINNGAMRGYKIHINKT